MGTFLFSPSRLIGAAGLLLAAAAVPVGLHPPPGTLMAACTSGEEEDTFTSVCTPFLVPNTSQGFGATAANPDIPEINGVPCTGRDSGACIGMSEDQAAMGPLPVPQSTVSSSP